ncbi:hypothetical protein P3S68_002283 [Capsicum galapagoense]
MTNDEENRSRSRSLRRESGRKNKRIGEVAGGTAAECAMVCCCCPCTLLHLLLALYKVPAGLCRKAWRNKKRKKKKKQLMERENNNNKNNIDYDDCCGGYYTDDDDKDYFHRDCDGTAEFETEMWHRFHGSFGFGRSLSQREEEEKQLTDSGYKVYGFHASAGQEDVQQQ